MDPRESDIVLRKLNEVMMFVNCDENIAAEMSDFFSFFAKSYKFNPKFKSGWWDGKIRLFNVGDRKLEIGLLTHLIEFCKIHEYSVHVDPELIPKKVDKTQLKAFIDELNLPFDLYDYQWESIKTCIQWERKTLISPTSSGKSLIIYCLFRWWLNQIDEDQRILLIVPTIDLVNQMFDNFQEYSEKNGWDASEWCWKSTDGLKNDPGKRIVISTWQSAVKMNRIWFQDFGVVLGDECHKFKATEVKKTAGAAVNARYRVGMTGTLTSDESKCNKLQIQGMFGKAIQFVSTKDLMDRGVVAKLNIKILQLRYSEKTLKIVQPLDYANEVKYAESIEKRNVFITRLATSRKGNILVMFQHQKHGDELKRLFETIQHDKEVFVFHGSNSSTKEREAAKKIMEEKTDVILVASYGLFSTGISIKNIDHMIFAGPPGKSAIKVLQTIGRGLRIKKGKTQVTLYDIVDMFHKVTRSKASKYLMKHANQRLKLYAMNEFDYSFKEILIEDSSES